MAESIHIDKKRLILLDPSFNSEPHISESKRLSTAPAGHNQQLLKEKSNESSQENP